MNMPVAPPASLTLHRRFWLIDLARLVVLVTVHKRHSGHTTK